MTRLIVPVYNGAPTLARTVPAVLAVEGVDEWVWVDDGSADGSADVVASLAAGEPRARVERLPANRGRSAARNAGAAGATADVLLFLDADVTPRPDHAAQMLAALGARHAVATVARFDPPLVRDPREPYAVYLRRARRGVPDVPAGTPVSWRFFVTAASATRRDAFERAGGFDERIVYSQDLALGCALSRISPDGLVASEARVGTSDVGRLDDAMGKVAQFGGDLVNVAERFPEVLALPGLAWLRGSRWTRTVVSSRVLAGTVRRALPWLPEPAVVPAVRYLLGHTLARAHADALAHTR